MKKVIRIQKYDPSITEAPFEFITLVDRIEFDEPEVNDAGVTRAEILREICAEHGYTFRFLSGSKEPGIDYEVTVRGELEDKLNIVDHTYGISDSIILALVEAGLL
jgi:hypothetical protein